MTAKKLFLLLTACFIILSANAYDCKIDNIYYNLDNANKTAAVTYKKELQASYKGSITIPTTINYNGATYSVTSIGDRAFYKSTALTSITIPNSVTSIGYEAFEFCSSITSITIPNSVTSIGNEAFAFCSSLTSISLSNSVTSIRNRAFYYCSSLTSITVPASVTSIGKEAFDHCDALTSISIPSSVTSIGSSAFSFCSSLASITIPNPVTSIGDYTFFNCSSLTSVSLPKSVTSIGKCAFYHCDALTSISIPNSITTIGDGAFQYCRSLTSISLPSSLTSIGKDAFADCRSLASINVPVNYKGELPEELKSKSKKVMPATSLEEYYASNPFISWEDYYASKSKRTLPQIDKEKISQLISADVEKWQKKGEFESTDHWIARVNDKTRAQRIDSIKQVHIDRAKLQQKQYQAEVEKLQKDYEAEYKKHYENLANEYIDLLTQLKKKDFANVTFDLNAPYDADHQSFLINTSTFGDILLPVPVAEAPAFKQNWNSIKSSITPHYVFDGNDVVLKQLTFKNGSKMYVYDSHTEAKYAVADINYNFAPFEIKDTDFTLQDIAINTPSIEQPTIAQTVAKKSDPVQGISKKKAEVDKTSITVGSGPTKADVDMNIPRGNSQADKTFALIIANENYRREGSVPYANNDGTILAEYLQSTLGIPQRNIQLYTDASLNDIKFGLNKLTQICEAFGNEASVIVYYAGHGIPDEKNGNAHLLPVDGYGSDVSTGYSLDNLYATLGALPAKQTVLLLDACFSGSQRGGEMMASNARGVRIRAKSGAANGNLIVLSAAQGDETAYPYEEKQHGMFTYFLLKKLNENKGNVTLGELADYVIANVKQTSILINDKMQTPAVNVSPELSNSWKSIRLGK